MDELDDDAKLRAPANVTRLHPVRTLVISRDLAFRQRATTVLAELGVVSFALAEIHAGGDTPLLIEKERPDVVVLDITGCAFSGAGVVYELYERFPRVGVVIVSGNADDDRLGLPALAKWGWATDLSRAVLDAYHHGNPLEDPLHVR